MWLTKKQKVKQEKDKMQTHLKRTYEFLNEEVENFLLKGSDLYSSDGNVEIIAEKTSGEIRKEHDFTFERIFNIVIKYPNSLTDRQFLDADIIDLFALVNYLNTLNIYFLKFFTDEHKKTMWIAVHTEEEFKHLTKRELRKEKLKIINKK